MEPAHLAQPTWYQAAPATPEIPCSQATSASQEIESSQQPTELPETAGLSSGIGSTPSSSPGSESEDEDMDTFSNNEDAVIFQTAIRRHKELKLEKQRVQLEAVRLSLEIAHMEKELERKKQHYHQLNRREDELKKMLNWCSELL